MKKFKFLLFLIALCETKTFSQSNKGLIFWSDFMYFKNHEENYYVKKGDFFLKDEIKDPSVTPPVNPPVTPPVIPPKVDPPIKPPVAPPTPIQPIPDPTSPDAPKPIENKYIFYNSVFYEGTDLETGVSPLGGDLTVNSTNKIGMGTIKEGYTIENQNTITLNQGSDVETLIGMQGSNGGKIVNKESGIIDVNSINGVGMSILNSGYAENNGTINAKMPMSSNTVAMQLQGTGSGANNGTINLYNTITAGATVENGTFTNNSKILGAARYGIALTGTGSVENAKNAQINLLGAFSGIYVGGGGTGTNNGDITIEDGTSAMMTTNGSITNNGTITMTTASYNVGKNPLEYNNGAMFTNGFGTAINSQSGIINLGTPTVSLNGYNAMNGQGTVIMQNDGTINIYALPMTPSGGIQSAQFAYSLSGGAIGKNTSTGIINLGEYGMINYGGDVYNWGTINKLSSNTQTLSINGKLIMEKGGTLNTVAKSSGENTMFNQVYLGRSFTGGHFIESGDLKLDSSATKSISNLKMNSIAYSVNKNDEGKYYFKRNKFEVLTDDTLGKYLDEIYYDSSNSLKNGLLDILVSADNNYEFEEYLDEIFGRGYFPSLIYQTNDAITFTNETILNQISKKTEATNRESYILGYSFEKMKKSGYENILGYDDEINSFFIGKNYPLNSYLSSGWILSYTRLNSKFKNGYGKREDNMFQGSGYLNYNRDNINAFGNLFLGYSKGDLSRDVNLGYLAYNEDFTDINFKSLRENLDSNLKNYYVGFLGKISKNYNFDIIYLEPVAKLQSVGIFQKSINESGGTYNLDLDKLNSMLNSAYIGTGLGKVMPIGKGALNLSLNVGVKQEFNDIDDTLKFKINSIGSEVGEIDLKNKNRFSKEIGVKGEVGNLWNGLSFYGEYKYIFSEENSWRVSGGVSVKF